MWHNSGFDPAIALATFLLAVSAMLVAMRMMRRQHDRRMRELAIADDLLSEHFRAVRELNDDAATPAPVRNLINLFSATVGRRDIAQLVARRMETREPWAGASETATDIVNRFQSAVRLLEQSRPELARKVAVAVDSGFKAMMLRWPETEYVALGLIVEHDAHAQSPEGGKLASVVSAAPREFIKAMATA